jgi:hypothetical protein
VDFELSEQQAAFRDLMRDFARKSISPVARESELAGRYPEAALTRARYPEPATSSTCSAGIDHA